MAEDTEFTEEVLAEVQEELQAEIDKWSERNLNIGAWRMGDAELMIAVKVDALIDLMKDHFNVSQLELDIRFKRCMIEALRTMFGPINEQRRAMLRQQIVDGIVPMQPRPPKG